MEQVNKISKRIKYGKVIGKSEKVQEMTGEKPDENYKGIQGKNR